MRKEINKIRTVNRFKKSIKRTMSGLKPFFPIIDKHPENPKKSTR
jgi:hypothetical protein